MTAYLIVNYDIEDADGYKSYQKGAAPALKIGSEAKLLVLDHNSNQVEGDNAGSNTVVLEFESMERAREIYESGDYQAVLPARLEATSKHFALLVEGFTPPAR
ncbi:MAG: DUF1330 domain-containing protein [Acidimicrobiales bacterium]